MKRVGDAISIGSLVADAACWPVAWRPIIDDDREWTGSFVGDDDDDSTCEIETGPDTNYSVDLGRFIADAVNAAPVLLEIAHAALAWRDAEPRTAGFDDAAQMLRVALRKVRP